MGKQTWLRRKRFEAEIQTCADLARMLKPEVTGEAVRKWETQESSPRKYYIPQLMAILNVSKEELYDYIADTDRILFEKRNGIVSDPQPQSKESKEAKETKEIEESEDLTVAEKMFFLDNRKKGGDKRLLRLMQQP